MTEAPVTYLYIPSVMVDHVTGWCVWWRASTTHYPPCPPRVPARKERDNMAIRIKAALPYEAGDRTALWPTFRDGSPVMPGDKVLSFIGPQTVDAIVVRSGGYSLLHHVNDERGRGYYVLDEGCFDADFALRPDEWKEEPEVWQPGDDSEPDHLWRLVEVGGDE